jgi:murein L,D-transpeptidase YcbB/YkuD
MSTKLQLLKDIRVLFAVSTIACTWLLASFGTPMSQIYQATLNAVTVNPSLQIETSLSTAMASDTGRAGFADLNAIEVFYKARANEPYWTGMAGPQDHAEDFIEALENSWKHGLNPHTFHIEEIRKLMESGEDRGRLELLLSDAFLRYARDLSGMRVEPGKLGLDTTSWRKPMSADEAMNHLGDKRMAQILEKIEPQGHTYKMLQQELVKLSKEKEEDYSAILPIEFGGLMRPGYSHKKVPDLRTRLGVDPLTQDKYLYDDRLAAAVMEFQRQHDLNPDGVIGSSTLHVLNRTKRDKMIQIIANLERLRWVPEGRPEKYVVVNIPAATLWAVEGGEVQFEMPVVVGTPVRQTESFIANIVGVRFNPDWTVPPTIKKYDILPKLQEDSEYLLSKGIELSVGRGENRRTIDPTVVDWQNITWKELNAMDMVQIPGAHNPLGKIRILMPNQYNIYLHDTNHPELFEDNERAQSSGCIRLKNPEQMAEFVMKGQEGWAEDSMNSILQTGRISDMKISNRIPVYVLYYTVWTDDAGRVVYGSDIYKQDKRLAEELFHIDGLSIPGNTVSSAVESGRAELVSAQQSAQ